jgi:hypothetical protein
MHSAFLKSGIEIHQLLIFVRKGIIAKLTASDFDNVHDSHRIFRGPSSAGRSRANGDKTLGFLRKKHKSCNKTADWGVNVVSGQ